MNGTKIIVLLFIFIYISCNTSENPIIEIEPKGIWISSLENNSTVSGLITLECRTEDDENIKSIELLVDSIKSGIIDNTPPFELEWDTREFKYSSTHSVMLMALTQDDKLIFSEALTIIINNQPKYLCDTLNWAFEEVEKYPSANNDYRIIFKQSGNLYSIDITGENLYMLSEKQISSIKISANRKKIIFVSSDKLHIVDINGNNEKELIDYSSSLSDVDISQSGEQVLYKHLNSINIINTKNNEISTIPYSDGKLYRFLSDSTVIFLRDYDMVIIDQKGKELNRYNIHYVISHSIYSTYLEPIHGTTKVLVNAAEAVYLYDLNTAEGIRIPINGDAQPSLSADGKTLFGLALGVSYDDAKSYRTLISIYNIETGVSDKILCRRDDKPRGSLSISPDNNIVAYTDRCYFGLCPDDIHILDRENKIKTRLTYSEDVHEEIIALVSKNY